MKKVSFLLITCFLVLNCSATITPKETVIKFITNFKKLDFEQAQLFVTDETKPFFKSLKLKYQNSKVSEDKLLKSNPLNQDEIIKEYGLNLLIETIVDKNAIVKPKDGTNQIILENINGYWKIICDKKLIDAINLESSYKKLVLDSYMKLENSCQRRANIVNNMINSINSNEANLIRQKLNEIKNINSDLSNCNLYITRQNELTKLILKFYKTANISENIKQELLGDEHRIAVNKLDLDENALKYNNKSFFGHILLTTNKEESKIPSVQFGL